MFLQEIEKYLKLVHQKEKLRGEAQKANNGKKHTHARHPQEIPSSDSLNEAVVRKEIADYEENENKASGKRKPKWSKTIGGKQDNWY